MSSSFVYSEPIEQQDLLDLVDSFFRSEISDDYLRKRLEHPVPSEDNFWQKLLGLGFFEYFESLAPEENPIGLLAALAKRSGMVPLPEALVDSLATGPLLLGALIAKGEREKVVELFGEQEVQNLLSGRATLALIPCHDRAVSTCEVLSEEKSGFKASLQATGVCLRPDTVGLVVCHGQTLLLAKIPKDSPPRVLSQNLCLDRLLPRGEYLFEGCSVIQLSSISVTQWKTLCAVVVGSELLGLAERVHQLTVEYVSQRKQFNVPVGSFQAVSQPLADCYLKLREMEALYFFTVKSLGSSDPQVEVLAQVFLAAAITRTPALIEKCLQLHGGIGFTWEYTLHLYLRRAEVYQALYRLDARGEEYLIEAAAAL